MAAAVAMTALFPEKQQCSIELPTTFAVDTALAKTRVGVVAQLTARPLTLVALSPGQSTLNGARPL